MDKMDANNNTVEGGVAVDASPAPQPPAPPTAAPKVKESEDAVSIGSSDSSLWSFSATRGSERERSKCFPFCPFPIISPSCAARLLLRNMLVPKEMWDEFPDGLSYSITDYFLYQPNAPKDARLFVMTPTIYSLTYEQVWMPTKDKVKIHGFLVKQACPDWCRKAPTIIFFHGNAGNIGHRLENAKLLHDDLNCNVLLVEYRGFGKSEGRPSEKGLYLDAQAAFNYVESREDLDPEKIVVFGRSLGGAVAIDLASRSSFRDRIAALIVENTFTGIPDLAKRLFDIAVLKWVPGFCYKNRFESLQKIEKVVCPSFFISGSLDEIIPCDMMRQLYDKCGASVKEITDFKKGTHNDTWTCGEYTEEIAELLHIAKIDCSKIMNIEESKSMDIEETKTMDIEETKSMDIEETKSMNIKETKTMDIDNNNIL